MLHIKASFSLFFDPLKTHAHIIPYRAGVFDGHDIVYRTEEEMTGFLRVQQG